jgi:bacteriorhodopsin
MRLHSIMTLIGFQLFVISSAMAQVTQPAPAPGTTAPGGTVGTTAATGGTNWLWIIIVLALVAAAIWYFTSRRRPPRV